MKKTYRLKLMVIARLLSEITMLVIFCILPMLAIVSNQFLSLSLPLRILLCSLSAIAIIALPGYASMTWIVTVNENGLATRSIFKRQSLLWSQLKGLKIKSNWHWRRYVVEFDGGELTFPIWLENQKELVGIIRKQLPQAGMDKKGTQAYGQGFVTLVFRFLKVAMGCAFIALFWIFYASVSMAKTSSQGDLLLLLFVCLCVTAIVSWRCFVIALMPKCIELHSLDVVIHTCFFERRLPWEQVINLSPTFFLLPEGFMLKTADGAYLIADDFDGADELVEAIQERLSRIARGK